MAEQSKGGLSRKVQKTFTRTKAKLLINFGKADKTSDEQFDDHVAKLDKQQETSHKFQKELRNYINSARGLQNASRSLYTAIQEIYEPEWAKNDTLKENLESMELMWGDYLQKLQEKVQEPLSSYMSHIPQLKSRISKRGRKLVDFDNARHSLEVLQHAKKKDENKIAKSTDDLNEAKKIYTELNEQLHNDLPLFYESRVQFYGESFESLFGADNLLHTELARMTSTLSDLSHDLAVENADKVYRPGSLYKSISTEHNDLVNGEGEHMNGHDSSHERDSPRDTPTEKEARPEPVRPPPPSPVQNDVSSHEPEPDPGSVYENQVSMTATEALSPEQTNGDSQEYSKPSPQPRRIDAEFSQSDSVDDKKDEDDEASAPEVTEQKGTEMLMKEEPLQAEEPSSPIYEPVTASSILPPQTVSESIKETIEELETAEDHEAEDQGEDDNVYQVPKSNVPIVSAAPDVVEVKPPNTLYSVTATHSYSGEDDDELSFPVGQKIYVIPFDDPEDQDEGWLYGAIPGEDGSFKKGVFPANFTQRC